MYPHLPRSRDVDLTGGRHCHAVPGRPGRWRRNRGHFQENTFAGYGDDIFAHHASIAINSNLQVGSTWQFSGSGSCALPESMAGSGSAPPAPRLIGCGVAGPLRCLN